MSVIGIVLVALFLRVWGVGWSLPYVDHPDEPAVVNVVLRILQGQLNPKHFFYPSLILYLQAGALQLHFWLGSLTGLYPESFTLPKSTHFYTTIPAAFIWARGFTALLCTATVAALATWGGRSVGQAAALIAAALLALSPWDIIHAHYITVDGPAAFFALLAVLSALQVLQRGSWRDYLVCGILIGLATGAKYQNVLVVLPLVLAHGLHWRGRLVATGGRLVSAGLLSALIFFCTSPYILLDFAGFSATMRTLFESYDGSHGDVRRPWPFDAYLWFHWNEGLGPLTFVLALVGIATLVRHNPPQALVLLSFPLALMIVLLSMQTHFYRNLLPLQPPLFLVAGIGAVALFDGVWAIVSRGLADHPLSAHPHLKAGMAAGSLVLVLLFSLGPAVQSSARLAQPDSRVAAQEWARREWPGVRIASEQSHPLRWEGVAQSTYVHYLPLRSLAWYREHGYGLLLANEGKRKREYWTEDYQPLITQGTIVATFGGQNSGYLGPRVDLIATGLTPSTIPSHTPQAQFGPLRLLGTIQGKLVEDTSGPQMQPDVPLHAGDTLALTAFWMVDQPVTPAHALIFVHLRDEQGRTLVQRDAPPWHGLFPLQQWPADWLVSESLDLPLPDSLPPGQYRLVMGLYDGSTQVRFAAYAGDDQLPHDEVDLGEVTVMP